MAIHGVDKTGSERDSPSPNVHDSMGDAPRPAHGTNSVNYATQATPSGINTVQLNSGNLQLVENGFINLHKAAGVASVSQLLAATSIFDAEPLLIYWFSTSLLTSPTAEWTAGLPISVGHYSPGEHTEITRDSGTLGLVSVHAFGAGSWLPATGVYVINAQIDTPSLTGGTDYSTSDLYFTFKYYLLRQKG